MSKSRRRTRTALAGMLVVASTAAAVVGYQAAHAADPAADARRGRVVHVTDGGLRVDRSAQIVASAPKSVTVGDRFTVSGLVRMRRGAHARPRVVRLQERHQGPWSTIATRRSTRGGTFRFTLDAGDLATVRELRAVAPRSSGLPAATSALVRVTVAKEPSQTPTETPTGIPTGPTEVPTGDWDPAEYPDSNEPAPVGQADDWSWLNYDGGGRWNPCATIRWAYNAGGSYETSLADVKRSFAILAGRTGLHFKYVGDTDYVPFTPGGVEIPTGVDIAVGWSDEAHSPALGDDVLGVGGGSGPLVAGADVGMKVEWGEVLLDRDETLRPGFATKGPPTWSQVMIHELMHVLGLGHARGEVEVMYPAVSSLGHRFGAGDLTGLARIGAAQGCL